MARKQIKAPRRGEIYLVNFDPTVGSEINKTRPALVIQNDTSNAYSPVTIVAAITSSNLPSKQYPTEVFVSAPEGGLTNDSIILLNQIRTVDSQRLYKRLGTVLPETMHEVNRAIAISLATLEPKDNHFGPPQGREIW